MLWCLVAAATAADLFVLENGGVLGVFHPDTETVDVIGAAGVPYVWGDLAYDWETDTLYMISALPPGTLYTLDRHTGVATAVGDTDLRDAKSLAVDPATGELVTVLAPDPHAMYALDRETGTPTWIRDVSRAPEDLMWDPITGGLVGSATFDGDLFVYDRVTWAAEEVAIGGIFGGGAIGLAYDPDQGAAYKFNEEASVHRYVPEDDWSGLWLGRFDDYNWSGAATDGDPRGGPHLVVDGTCPGPVGVALSRLTPGGRVAVIAGTDAGAEGLAAGPCAGTDTGLTGVVFLAQPTADGDGAFSADLTLPDAACGRWLRVLDLTTCERSNVRRL